MHEHTPHVSPNRTITPRLIVVHYTAGGSASSTVKWCMEPESKVSYHIIIDRTGDVWQIVDFNRRAWHAGKSQYLQWTDLNSHSIGLAFANYGLVFKTQDKLYCILSNNEYYPIPNQKMVEDHPHPNIFKYPLEYKMHWESYTQQQLTTYRAILRVLLDTYPIEHVIGHQHCAPNRKIDPGPAFKGLPICRDDLLAALDFTD